MIKHLMIKHLMIEHFIMGCCTSQYLLTAEDADKFTRLIIDKPHYFNISRKTIQYCIQNRVVLDVLIAHHKLNRVDVLIYLLSIKKIKFNKAYKYYPKVAEIYKSHIECLTDDFLCWLLLTNISIIDNEDYHRMRNHYNYNNTPLHILHNDDHYSHNIHCSP